MCEFTMESGTAKQIKLIRKYLKLKIVEDNISFRNHTEERNHVYELMKRTIAHGESHSALIIGPRGSGKTTLINSVLHQLSKEVDLEDDAIIVKLNGLIHSDEKIALKSITAQMQLENAVGDKVFGSFAENLAFLLSCLQSGSSGSKSMVFILEQMELFCKPTRTQTLLYNLFDVTHNPHLHVCVIGVTNRLDVMESLEKRVKSRFSHRHILVFPTTDQPPTEYYKQVLVQLLSLPVRKLVKKGRRRRSASITKQTEIQPELDYAIPDEILHKCNVDPAIFEELEPTFVQDWNAHIMALAEDEKLVDAIEKFCYYTVNEQIFRNVLLHSVCKLGSSCPFIECTQLVSTIDNTVASEHGVRLLCSLSILELSLVIAMKHGMDIFEQRPMNFEMVLHRYTKFANTNSSTQTVPRPVILKAFEHLQELEVILPVSTDNPLAGSRVQKEYKLYTLAVPVEDISEAVKMYRALPTEIGHWYHNSIV